MKFRAIAILFLLILLVGVSTKADGTGSTLGNNGFLDVGGIGQPAAGSWNFGVQVLFATLPSITETSHDAGGLEIIDFNYAPGGVIDITGPRGFQLLGTLTGAHAEVTSDPLFEGNVGSIILENVSADFTATRPFFNEQFQGSFNITERFNCCEQDVSVITLQQVSMPEPGCLLLLAAGLFGLTVRRRRIGRLT